MPRYVITVTGGNARRLENWFGGQLEIGPVGEPGAALIATIDAISEEEWVAISNRLDDTGPLYHHGGAEAVAGPRPDVRHGPQPHPPPV